MKKVLVIPALLLSMLTRAQLAPVTSVKWVANDLKYITFYQDQVNFDLSGYNNIKRFRVERDTLVMVDDYTSSADNFKTRHIDLFKFLMRRPDKKTLILIPVDKNAHNISGAAQFTFKDLSQWNENIPAYDKITFSAGWCYGTCPIIRIEIDQNGDYRMFGEEHTEPYKEAFKGKLNAMQVDSLNFLLRHSLLSKMRGWKQKGVVMDAPNYKLCINFKNSPLTIETNDPPLNVVALLNFLVDSYKHVALAPDPESPLANKQ